VTPSQKFFIALFSNDPVIFDPALPIGNFFTLFDYPNTKSYLWSKQHSNSLSLHNFIESMDINSDETKGCILFSNLDAGNSGATVTYYDLLFLSMGDGSLIR
jgi:hypothetical protein